jgi:hypothetical protein
VDDLGSTGEVVALRSVDFSIGAHTQDLVPEETNVSGAGTCRKISLFSHDDAVCTSWDVGGHFFEVDGKVPGDFPFICSHCHQHARAIVMFNIHIYMYIHVLDSGMTCFSFK